MAGKPITVIGNMHVCPMVTGLIPHVGGPVSGPGIPGVLINGLPVSVMGDLCICTGPPDTIVTGCTGVLIDGTPVVTLGALTAHGGQVMEGVPGVLISSSAIKPAHIPIKRIPFPDISFVSWLFSPKQAMKAQNEINIVRDSLEQECDVEPLIYNLRWIKDDKITRLETSGRKVILKVSVKGIAEGETVVLKVYKKVNMEKTLTELQGKVKDGEVEVEWFIDEKYLEDSDV